MLQYTNIDMRTFITHPIIGFAELQLNETTIAW